MAKPKIGYETNLGTCFHGNIEDILIEESFQKYKGMINLIFFSPPFPLNRKKRYGNLNGTDYIDWLTNITTLLKDYLTADGSLVVEIGNSWEENEPVMSTLPLETLLSIKNKGNYKLCQQFVWFNTAKLPSPVQWVNIERTRVKDAFTNIWWLSKTSSPKANNKNILEEYSSSMKKLLKSQKYNAGLRPSEHSIGEKSFLKNNGGAIPANVLVSANTVSNSKYLTDCKELGLPSPQIDEILGEKFKVLDDGFIRVVDYMGTDQSIVQAARVSYGQGTKKLSEDRGLIRYLMRHSHTTPFEMCEIKLHVRVPMDCWRQWIRHRTANVNEYSTRYSIAIDSAQKTPSNEWRRQSIINKQGSGEYLNLDIGGRLTEAEDSLHKQIRDVYKERIDSGVAREQARKDLPLSTYTEAYWKVDLHNLFHFLALRMDTHAQYEIRSYANILGHEIVKRWCPLSWEAFENYRLNASSLSEIEINVVKSFLAGKPIDAKNYLIALNLLSIEEGKLKLGREAEEIEKKLIKLGINVDWNAY